MNLSVIYAKVAVSLVLALGASVAFGCSPLPYNDKPPHLAEQAKKQIERADAVVDGEIIRISGYDQKTKRLFPAILKVKRIIKGQKLPIFYLRYPQGGCEIAFSKKERVRLLLSRDGNSWAALYPLNQPYPDSRWVDDRLIDYTGPFAKAIDKQIGFSRSADTVAAPAGW